MTIKPGRKWEAVGIVTILIGLGITFTEKESLGLSCMATGFVVFIIGRSIIK